MESVANIREMVRRLRERSQSPSYRRRARKLRCNRRQVKKVVRVEEARVAALLSSTRPRSDMSADSASYKDRLAALEGFLTWRLKIPGCKGPLWCDGVHDLALTWQPSRTVSIKGTALIGPADDVSRGCRRFELAGFLILDSRGRRLTSYALTLARGTERYLATRQPN
jgi:hypothetical protein